MNDGLWRQLAGRGITALVGQHAVEPNHSVGAKSEDTNGLIRTFAECYLLWGAS